MRRVWLRAGCVIAMLGVAAAAGYHVFITEQQITQERATQHTFSSLGWTLTLSLSELRASQQAYVAAGQSRSYWMAEATEQMDAIRSDLASLARMSTAPGTTRAIEDAILAIDQLAELDSRVRDHTATGQDLMASDLIFADGLNMTHTAAAHVGRAQTTERAAREVITANHRNSQGVALAAAIGASVFVSLLLVPVAPPPRAAAAEDNPDEVSASAVVADGYLHLDLQQSIDATPQETTNKTPVPDLRLAADLCKDLGQVSAEEELPVLLARTAQILNASGIIVWVRNEQGTTLRPALSHGYPADTLARFGELAHTSETAIAAAFRDSRTYVVESDGETAGAVVVPLVSATGCTGAVSMELKDGWEVHQAVQSTATIIAAQLSTFVAADTSAAADTGTDGADGSRG